MRCRERGLLQSACMGGRFFLPECPDCQEAKRWNGVPVALGVDPDRLLAYRRAVAAGFYTDWPDGMPAAVLGGIVGWIARSLEREYLAGHESVATVLDGLADDDL